MLPWVTLGGASHPEPGAERVYVSECACLNSPLFPWFSPFPHECVSSSNSEMQNPVQSAQEKTAFEMGLYGYPYVRAPKKGRRAWFSASSPPPAQPLAFPCRQVYQATLMRPDPSQFPPPQLPGLSPAPGKIGQSSISRTGCQSPYPPTQEPGPEFRQQFPWGSLGAPSPAQHQRLHTPLSR